MFKLVRASFNQRRKTLQNGLNNSPDIPYTKEQIIEAIESLGVSPSIRGEALTLDSLPGCPIILRKMHKIGILFLDI